MLYTMEKHLIFYPESKIEMTPDQFGLSYEDVYFKTSDGVNLNGWLVPAKNSIATIIYFHGNAGNISYWTPIVKLFNDRGVSVFIVDYRGYGRSSGDITEAGLYLDGEAAFDYLNGRPDIDKNRIAIFGMSLGSAIGIDLALKRPCKAIIIENGFTNTSEMAKTIFPFSLFRSFLTFKFDSLSKIKNIKNPKLFIHGMADEIVPFEMGQKLFSAATGPKEFYSIPGATHNDTFLVGGDEYFEVITEFLTKYL